MKNKPVGLKPVLAKLEHQNSLGKSTWCEVVYFNYTSNEWESYLGSDTFNDGEKVVAWQYVDKIELPNVE